MGLYTVSVDDAVTATSKESSETVVLYVIRISHESRGLCVMLRYSELRTLHVGLLDRFRTETHRLQQLEACGFPSRRPFTVRTNEKVIQERKALVERYLSNMFDLVYVLEDKDVRKIFRLDELGDMFKMTTASPIYSRAQAPRSRNDVPFSLQPAGGRPASSASLLQQSNSPSSFSSSSSSSTTTPVDRSGSLDSPATVDDEPSSKPTTPSLRHVFTPFTIEKTRHGVRSWIWTQIKAFDYHAVKTVQPLKLRYVALKRQVVSVKKVKTVHSIQLSGGCSVDPGSSDHPVRLRNSLRAGFPFAVDCRGTVFHFAARSPLDLAYWTSALRALPAQPDAPFVLSSTPALEQHIGSSSVHAGWLLFFAPNGKWKQRYCVFHRAALVFQLCKKVNVLHCSVQRAVFSTPRRIDGRSALMVCVGQRQQIGLVFDHALVQSIWSAALRLAQQHPLYDFGVVSFEEIVESSGAAGGQRVPGMSDVDRAIALGRRRSAMSSSSSSLLSSLNQQYLNPVTSRLPHSIAATVADNNNNNNNDDDAAAAAARQRLSLKASLVGSVADCDHLHFRTLVNDIIAANPRPLFAPLSRSRLGATAASGAPLRVLSLDGGVLESALRNASVLQLLERQLGKSVVDAADVIVATSECVLLAAALANGFTLDCCLKLLEHAVAHTLGTHLVADPLAGPAYSSRYFELLCQELFVGRSLAALSRCVLFPAFHLTAPHIRAFHNLPPAYVADGLAAAAAAAAATTGAAADEPLAAVVLRSIAAPAAFSSHDGYLDGSVAAVNPASFAVAALPEAKLPAVRLLSVGRVDADPPAWGAAGAGTADWGLFHWAPHHHALGNVASGQMSEFVAQSLLRDRYHRVAVPLPDVLPTADAALLGQTINTAVSALDTSATVAWLQRNWLDAAV